MTMQHQEYVFRCMQSAGEFEPAFLDWSGAKRTSEFAGFAHVLAVGDLFVKVYDGYLSDDEAFRVAQNECALLLSCPQVPLGVEPLAFGMLEMPGKPHGFPALIESRRRGTLIRTLIEGDADTGEDAPADALGSSERLNAAVAVARAATEVAEQRIVGVSFESNAVCLDVASTPWRATFLDYSQAYRVGGRVASELMVERQPYTSPERMRGCEFFTSAVSVQPPSDVWCLGELCYYLLTDHERLMPQYGAILKRTRGGLTANQALLDLLCSADGEGLPAEVVESLGSAGEEVSAVVRDCLRYDPSWRPTAAEVAERLESAAEHLH